MVFNLIIRQPNFITGTYATETIGRVLKKKSYPLLNKVEFEEIEEGEYLQMLHVGIYDSKHMSFALMEAFASKQGMLHQSKILHYIYLSNARKTQPDKLGNILRFWA